MNGNGLKTPTRSFKSRPVARQAFTLVELLVVIVIIGILLALLVPTIGNALSSAKTAQMGIEVSNIAQALEAYRSKVGAYPPDFAPTTAAAIKTKIDTHLARQYRYRNIQADGVPSAQIQHLDPSEAIVFWLRGLSNDPKRPLTGAGDRTPFFDFNESQLDDKDSDGFPEYYPKGTEAPLVYLHHSSYGAIGGPANIIQVLDGAVNLRAYATEIGNDGQSVARFAEPEKYQLICAGQDSEFGTNGEIQPVYPDARGYTSSDDDNLTNFSEGKTLKDAIP